MPEQSAQDSPRGSSSKGTKRKRDNERSDRDRNSPVEHERSGSSRERQKKKSRKSDAPCKYWLEGICDKVRFIRCLRVMRSIINDWGGGSMYLLENSTIFVLRELAGRGSG